MSLLFATGFGLTTTLADLVESVNGGSISAVGRNSGNGVHFGNGDQGIRKNLGVNAATVVTGFSVRVNSAPAAQKCLCRIADAGSTQCQLLVDSAGNMTFTGTAATAPLTFGSHQYVEIKVTIHNTTGSVEVRVNGLAVMTATGINTRAGTANAYANQVGLGVQNAEYSGGFDRDFDDWYVLDTVGSSLNNFLGDVRVDERLPDGAGDSTQWTPSTGANYTCVDETPRNDDTDYVSSSTVGQKDLFTFADLSSTSGVVKAVVVEMRARKDDAGTRTIKAKVKHGATEGNGAERGLSTSYAYTLDAFATNPSTSVAWTIAEVNAAQVGVEVVA